MAVTALRLACALALLCAVQCAPWAERAFEAEARGPSGEALWRAAEGGGARASNEHCDSCTAETGKVLGALDNNATMGEIQRALDLVCIALPVDTKQCRSLVAAVVYNVEKLDKKLLEDYSPRQLCTILSFCTAECCGTPYWPQEIHIALGADPSHMVVMWTTLMETPTPQVLIGESPDSLSRTVAASAHTYTQGGWLGTLYTATVEQLAPSTRYYYTVGDPAWVFSKTTYSFVSAPAPAPTSARRRPALALGAARRAVAAASGTSASFAIYGDMGATNAMDNTLLRLLAAADAGEIDFVLHVGDMSYADGYQPLWDQFLVKLEPLAARVPYMTTAGNHEDFFDFTAYRNRFQMPVQNLGNVSRSNMSLFWSTNYGPVHVIAFSCEGYWGIAPDLKPGGAQYEWLVNDLAQANANRDQQPWIVMFAHRPLYCSYNSKKRCEVQAGYYRGMIEQVIADNAVDVVVGAHLHNYERTLPVFASQPAQANYSNPSAPVYAVVGTGGNKEGTQGNFQQPPPAWSAGARLSEWGFARVQVDGACSLQWSFVGSTSGDVLDSFTITRPC